MTCCFFIWHLLKNSLRSSPCKSKDNESVIFCVRTRTGPFCGRPPDSVYYVLCGGDADQKDELPENGLGCASSVWFRCVNCMQHTSQTHHTVVQMKEEREMEEKSPRQATFLFLLCASARRCVHYLYKRCREFSCCAIPFGNWNTTASVAMALKSNYNLSCWLSMLFICWWL